MRTSLSAATWRARAVGRDGHDGAQDCRECRHGFRHQCERDVGILPHHVHVVARPQLSAVVSSVDGCLHEPARRAAIASQRGPGEAESVSVGGAGSAQGKRAPQGGAGSMSGVEWCAVQISPAMEAICDLALTGIVQLSCGLPPILPLDGMDGGSGRCVYAAPEIFDHVCGVECKGFEGEASVLLCNASATAHPARSA